MLLEQKLEKNNIFYNKESYEKDSYHIGIAFCCDDVICR